MLLAFASLINRPPQGALAGNRPTTSISRPLSIGGVRPDASITGARPGQFSSSTRTGQFGGTRPPRT